jgi:hypothetical protein
MCTVRTTNADSVGRGGGTEGLCPVGNTAPFNPFSHCLLVIYEGKVKVVPIRWPWGLKTYSGSAAVRLLGTRFRMPLKAWMLLPCVGCVLCMQRPLRRVDHLFRGVLPCARVRARVCVCACVCVSYFVWTRSLNNERSRPKWDCCVTKKM